MNDHPEELAGDRRIRVHHHGGELERVVVEPAEPSASPAWAPVDAPARRRLGPGLRRILRRPTEPATPEAAPVLENPVEVLREREMAGGHPSPLAPAWAKVLGVESAPAPMPTEPTGSGAEPPGTELPKVEEETEPLDPLAEGVLEARVDAILAARLRSR